VFAVVFVVVAPDAAQVSCGLGWGPVLLNDAYVMVLVLPYGAGWI
jgi:hypothetical protein